MPPQHKAYISRWRPDKTANGTGPKWKLIVNIQFDRSCCWWKERFRLFRARENLFALVSSRNRGLNYVIVVRLAEVLYGNIWRAQDEIGDNETKPFFDCERRDRNAECLSHRRDLVYYVQQNKPLYVYITYLHTKLVLMHVNGIM